MQQRYTMRQLPASDRPYEKLEKLGAEVLSDAELMAVILRTGSRHETSVDLARRVLKMGGNESLAYLHTVSLKELMDIEGIGRVKAFQIKALAELSKRIASKSIIENKITVKTPNDVANIMMEEMRHLEKEVFRIILLNTKNNILKTINVSVGSLNASIVHPREVFREVLKNGCSAVVLVHNHPSGDPEPSREDVDTTNRLVSAGSILGIKILDHIIIGDGKFVSLKEKGII